LLGYVASFATGIIVGAVLLTFLPEAGILAGFIMVGDSDVLSTAVGYIVDTFYA